MGTVRRIMTVCIGVAVLFSVGTASSDTEYLSGQVEKLKNVLTLKETDLNAANKKVIKYAAKITALNAALAVVNNPLIPYSVKKEAIKSYLVTFEDHTNAYAELKASNHQAYVHEEGPSKKAKYQKKLDEYTKRQDKLAKEVDNLRIDIAVKEAELAEQRKIDEEYFKDKLGFRIKRHEELLKRVQGWHKRDLENERKIEQEIKRLKEMQKEEALQRGEEIQRRLNEGKQARTEEVQQTRRLQKSSAGFYGGGAVFGSPKYISPTPHQQKLSRELAETAEQMGEGIKISSPEGGKGNAVISTSTPVKASGGSEPLTSTTKSGTPKPAKEPPPFDLSGEWKLWWRWSVTSMTFFGSVSGGNNQWSYNGTFESETNAVWNPAKGSGSIQCSLSGQPGSSEDNSARMSCTATFPEGTMQAQSTGKINIFWEGRHIRVFEYKGKGTGTNTEGKKSSVDNLELKRIDRYPPGATGSGTPD